MSSLPSTCPVCGQPTVIETRPFCSRGCRDRDLLQWFGEGYRIPDSAPPAALAEDAE